jgi:hypothetical protein
MRVYLLSITLLLSVVSSGQMRPVGKVCIVEGVVADRETLKGIPSAILYNDSLGIMTTSDQTGYFKLVAPLELLKEKQTIRIDIVKDGYKRNGSGFSYNSFKGDTNSSASGRYQWNQDVKIFWMATNESRLSPNSGAYARALEGVHSATAVLLTFQRAVASELRDRKMESLKSGNEKVFFLINGKAALATATSDVYFDSAEPVVFIDNEKVKLGEINNLLKRGSARVDWTRSDDLAKRLKKDVIVFTFEK